MSTSWSSATTSFGPRITAQPNISAEPVVVRINVCGPRPIAEAALPRVAVKLWFDLPDGRRVRLA